MTTKKAATLNGNGQLTDLERTKMENFALKHNLIQQQLQAIVMERANYIQSIETAHPGFKWDEREGLVPTDKPN
jgi:hypothetical protein